MLSFTSADLQRRTGEVQASAGQEPVVLTDYGKPRNVMLSVDEYVRLKKAAGETISPALIPKRPVVARPSPDALGYDTHDLDAAARRMAEDALSGSTAVAVDAELARVRSLFAGARR